MDLLNLVIQLVGDGLELLMGNSDRGLVTISGIGGKRTGVSVQQLWKPELIGLHWCNNQCRYPLLVKLGQAARDQCKSGKHVGMVVSP